LPNLYIISGCNGAGKTTASFTILPDMLNCKEFVNADSIAAGLSPFNPESVAIEAGRIMLMRINRGISNLITLFIPVADTWMIVNSTNVVIEPIAEGGLGIISIISNDYIWGVILDQSKVYGVK